MLMDHKSVCFILRSSIRHCMFYANAAYVLMKTFETVQNKNDIHGFKPYLDNYARHPSRHQYPSVISHASLHCDS